MSVAASAADCPLDPTVDPARPTEVPDSSYDVAVFANRFPSFAPLTVGPAADAPPPVLLTHGSEDNVIPVDALFMSAEGLAEAGIPTVVAGRPPDGVAVGYVDVTEDVAQPEDRPHRVTDRGVDVTCLDRLAHGVILPR